LKNTVVLQNISLVLDKYKPSLLAPLLQVVKHHYLQFHQKCFFKITHNDIAYPKFNKVQNSTEIPHIFPCFLGAVLWAQHNLTS
jgi:hypothetical protein